MVFSPGHAWRERAPQRWGTAPSSLASNCKYTAALGGIKMNARQLNINDIDAVKIVFLNTFSKTPWNDTWTCQQLHEYISEIMENRSSLSFGIYQNDILVGIALGRIKSWYEGTEYWIEEFGILPELQQNGIGSKFISEIEAILSQKGIAHIVLLTERNVPAYRFYKKNGFEENSEITVFSKAVH